MDEAVILSVCPRGVYLRLMRVLGELFCLGWYWRPSANPVYFWSPPLVGVWTTAAHWTQLWVGLRSTHTTGLGHLGQDRNTCAGHPWHPWGHEGMSGGLGVGGRGVVGWCLLENDVKERAFIPFFCSWQGYKCREEPAQ